MEAVRCKTYVRKSNQQQISTLKAVDMEVILTSMSAGEVTRGWRTEGGREGTAGSLEGTLHLGVEDFGKKAWTERKRASKRH